MERKVEVLEAVVVLLILALIACAGGSKLTDWSAAAAVFLGFLYSRTSFDIAEGSSGDTRREGAAYLKRLFVMKEAVWIATFALLGSWPLLAGALMFISYPAIRGVTRRRLDKGAHGVSLVISRQA